MIHRLTSATLALSLGLTTVSLPAPSAQAAMAKKRKKKPSFDTEAHAAQRTEAQDGARAAADGGDLEGAADQLQTAAAESGDPVLYLDAADMILRAARDNRSIDTAENSREPARIALDVLYFLDDEHADPDWKVADPFPTADLITRANEHMEKVDELIAEIEAEEEAARAAAAAEEDGKKKKKKREKKPGTGMLIAGGTLAGVGLAGIGVMAAGIVQGKNAQAEVEDLAPVAPGDPDYPAFQDADSRGKRANTIAIVGATLAGIGLIGGATLIGLGIKKRKAGKNEEQASVWMAPSIGGVVVGGRF